MGSGSSKKKSASKAVDPTPLNGSDTQGKSDRDSGYGENQRELDESWNTADKYTEDEHADRLAKVHPLDEGDDAPQRQNQGGSGVHKDAPPRPTSLNGHNKPVQKSREQPAQGVPAGRHRNRAAIKIQAGYRGFKVRKNLEEQKKADNPYRRITGKDDGYVSDDDALGDPGNRNGNRPARFARKRRGAAPDNSGTNTKPAPASTQAKKQQPNEKPPPKETKPPPQKREEVKRAPSQRKDPPPSSRDPKAGQEVDESLRQSPKKQNTARPPPRRQQPPPPVKREPTVQSQAKRQPVKAQHSPSRRDPYAVPPSGRSQTRSLDPNASPRRSRSEDGVSRRGRSADDYEYPGESHPNDEGEPPRKEFYDITRVESPPYDTRDYENRPTSIDYETPATQSGSSYTTTDGGRQRSQSLSETRKPKRRKSRKPHQYRVAGANRKAAKKRGDPPPPLWKPSQDTTKKQIMWKNDVGFLNDFDW